MIAYSREGLHHARVLLQLQDAHDRGWITESENTACRTRYPALLYTPKMPIRVGLFVLTLVIAIFTCGLLMLLTELRSTGGFASRLIFFALAAYGSLEFLVGKKQHYRSGVDDALQWFCICCLVIAGNVSGDPSIRINALLVCIPATLLYIRFAGPAMAALSCGSFLLFVFFRWLSGRWLVLRSPLWLS